MRFFIKAILPFVIIAASQVPLQAAIINATDATDTAINTAIGLASDGDTVVVPAGTETWTGSIDFDDKDITVQGAGSDQTIITRSGRAVIMVDADGTSSGFHMRLTGFKFINGSTSSNGNATLLVSTPEWSEVDNCIFEGTLGNDKNMVAHYQGSNAGSPQSGIFYDNTVTDQRFLVEGNVGAVKGSGNYFASGLPYAEAQGTVFIEGCTFNASAGTGTGNQIDSSHGASYIIRHSTFNHLGADGEAQIAAHGTEGDTERSNIFAIIHDNIINRPTGTSNTRIIWIRGGSSYVYNNTITGDYGTNDFKMDSEVRFSSSGQGNDEGVDGNLPWPEVTDVYYHTGADNASTLTATGAGWTASEWVDMVLYNRNDGSSGTITANTTDTITATLSGGTDNDWDTDDQFYVADTTGTHTGSDGASTLTDSGAQSWTLDKWVNNNANQGSYVWNITDGSKGSITTNAASPTNTVTATLSGAPTGSITAFADAGGGQVTVTSTAHGLTDDMETTISGTTNYNGTFVVANATANTFEITDTWVSDDATGSFAGDNDWDTGDVYKITDGWPWRDQLGAGRDVFEYQGDGNWPDQEFGYVWGNWEWNNTRNGGDIDYGLANNSNQTAWLGREVFNDLDPANYWNFTEVAYPHPNRSDASASLRRSSRSLGNLLGQ